MVVLTGAGISAESGVPTFRGPGGYWRKWKATVTVASLLFLFSLIILIFET